MLRDVRQNKGSILKASVLYIKHLKNDQFNLGQLEEKCKIQEYQNRKLLLKLKVGYTCISEHDNFLFQEYEERMKVNEIPVHNLSPKSFNPTEINNCRRNINFQSEKEYNQEDDRVKKVRD